MYKATSAVFLGTSVIFCGLWLSQGKGVAVLTPSPASADSNVLRLNSELALAKAEAEKLRKERDAMIALKSKSSAVFADLKNAVQDDSFYVGNSPAHERLLNLIESMRKAELEQEKESLDQDLTRLYGKLNLSGEEKDRLDALILELNLLERNPLGKNKDDLEADLATVDKDLKSLLGSRYAVLQDYRDKHEAYSRIDNLNETLGNKQLPPLSEDRVDSLAALITDTLKAPYSIDIQAKGGWQKLTEAERQTIIDERKAKTAQITQSSGLSAEQQELLKDHLRWRGGR